MPSIKLPPQVTAVTHHGLQAWQVQTRHGQAIVARHGGQLLSWAPLSQHDVFWLSPRLKPLPAAIRGGVPVCWPWFAKQGMPAGGQQHGPVRNLSWDIAEVTRANDDVVELRLAPGSPEAWPAGLSLTQSITLDGRRLNQSLHTHNHSKGQFRLTQALHSYFAVGDARRVRIDGLQHLRYRDKLQGDGTGYQMQPFAFDTACDRVYGGARGPYVLHDAAWQRRITVQASGSQTVVVWNPGAEQAAAMPDVGPAWLGFFCVEVANAGDDVVTLAPGASHTLTQQVTVEALAH